MNDNTNFEFASADLSEDTTEQIAEKVTIKHLTGLFSMKTSLQNDLFHTKQMLDSSTRNYEDISKSIELAEQRMLENPLAYTNNFHELKQYEAACLSRLTSMLFMQQNHISIQNIEESIDKVSKEIEQAIIALKGQ